MIVMNKQKGNTPIVWVIIITVCISIGGFTWYFFSYVWAVPQKKLNEYSPSPSLDGSRTAEPSDISDWKTYRNEEFGFELRLPPAWKEYTATAKANLVEFGLPDQKVLFVIGVITKKEWESHLANDALTSETFILERGDHIFFYSRAHDYTDKNLARSAEIPSIISTLVLSR